MWENSVTVTFLSKGKKIAVSRGESLLTAAIAAGLEVDAVCGGKGSCGKCRARVVDGPAGVATEAERKLLTPAQLQAGVVLLCQRSALGDVTLEMEPALLAQRGYIPVKGSFDGTGLAVDPPVAKTLHRLAPPTVQNQTADLERLLNQLPAGIAVKLELLKILPSLLRDAGYLVTSVVCGHSLITVEKGNTVPEMYGLALDLGTTSVAGYLADLRTGRMAASVSTANRQRVHGADVISRTAYTLENPAGLAEMQELMARTIDEIVDRATEQAGISPERIYLLTLIGNTVMSHLLLGVSPAGVVSAPFVPAFTRSITGTAKELGLKSLPGRTPFVLLPNIAGYVGSDTVGVILATKIYDLPGNWLAVDVGTNGEIVLAADKRLLTCSTAAGPAFEGASISQGMRAEPGAIYKVRLADDVQVSVVDGGEPVGICGSGLIDTVAEMLRLGILKTNGRIKNPGELPDLPAPVKNRIRQSSKGCKFVLAEGSREVAVTQKDISELQLGKGAIRAGIEILMEEMGLSAKDLDGIMLAGAFGSNLNPASVRDIGLLPPVDINRIKPVGNAAGLGALMALLDKKQLELALELPERVEHVELSLRAGFQRKFARALGFNMNNLCNVETR